MKAATRQEGLAKADLADVVRLRRQVVATPAPAGLRDARPPGIERQRLGEADRLRGGFDPATVDGADPRRQDRVALLELLAQVDQLLPAFVAALSVHALTPVEGGPRAGER